MSEASQIPNTRQPPMPVCVPQFSLFVSYYPLLVDSVCHPVNRHVNVVVSKLRNE